MKLILAGAISLLVALGLEHAVFPLMNDPWGVIHLGEARIVALAVILAGCLRGELQALPFAIVAGALAGSVWGEGYVGCTLVSFSLAAYVAAGASRWFYFDQFSIRFLVLFGLIVFESFVWAFTRHLFWPESGIQIPWLIHAIVALIGAVLYIPLMRWLGRRMTAGEPIGRRKNA